VQPFHYVNIATKNMLTTDPATLYINSWKKSEQPAHKSLCTDRRRRHSFVVLHVFCLGSLNCLVQSMNYPHRGRNSEY
jgi:hypothetical protein